MASLSCAQGNTKTSNATPIAVEADVDVDAEAEAEAEAADAKTNAVARLLEVAGIVCLTSDDVFDAIATPPPGPCFEIVVAPGARYETNVIVLPDANSIPCASRIALCVLSEALGSEVTIRAAGNEGVGFDLMLIDSGKRGVWKRRAVTLGAGCSVGTRIEAWTAPSACTSTSEITSGANQPNRQWTVQVTLTDATSTASYSVME